MTGGSVIQLIGGWYRLGSYDVFRCYDSLCMHPPFIHIFRRLHETAIRVWRAAAADLALRRSANATARDKARACLVMTSRRRDGTTPPREPRLRLARF